MQKITLKDAIIELAKSSQESKAAQRAAEMAARTKLEKFKNDLFSEIHKELTGLKELTVFTNTPFKSTLDLRDFTLKTPCGNLSVGQGPTGPLIVFVDEKGARTEFPLNPETKVEELKENLLELFKHSIASNLRISKPA